MARYDPVTKILHGRQIPQIYHDLTSVGHVVLHALSDCANKVLQVNDDDGVELTGKEIAEMMTNIAKHLYRIGLRSGDVAGLCASNTTYVAPSILGCLLLRLPISPADKFFDISLIKKIYRKTKPKVVFCDHDVIDKITEVFYALESDVILVSLTERVGGALHILDLIGECKIAQDEFIYNTPTNVIPAYIACTSGSTGDPKLAIISHLHQLQLYMWFEDPVEIKFSYCPASLYFLYGITNIVCRTLYAQKRLISAKPFTPDLFFDMLEKHKFNEANLFTPLLKLLVESPRFKTADFSCLDIISTGGFVTPNSFRQIFREKLTKGVFIVGYKTTEAGGVASKIVTETSTSSIGSPCINTKVKIHLDDGTVACLGEIGEVLVQHPVKFTGYLNNDPVAKVDDEGWYHTDDMGFIDENYELNIVGQRTQAIKNIHGEIYPFEIEGRIEAINGVKRVVVVGTPDIVEMDVPTALIVKDEESDVDEDKIREVLNDLPDYHQLRGGIFFVNALPIPSSGKINRFEAKEIATRLKLEREAS